jgi:hypothetical protein
LRNPTILVGLGSGREAWLSPDLSSLRFRLETENDKTTEETLTLAELKTALPNATNLVADVVAEAIRTNRSLTT